MKTGHNIFYSLLIIGSIFYACNPHAVIHESKSVSQSWQAENKINFEFEIKDSIPSYSFYMIIRNNEDYAFSNIYFFVNTYLPNGTYSRDTIECILADVRGKWKGQGMGSLKESEHLIRQKLTFPRTGAYRIEIEQAMRVEKLTGVKDVGIKIVKNTEN